MSEGASGGLLAVVTVVSLDGVCQGLGGWERQVDLTVELSRSRQCDARDVTGGEDEKDVYGPGTTESGVRFTR